VDAVNWYSNSYTKLILYLAVSSGIILIVYFKGDTIKEWSIYTTSVTILINFISKLFGRKPGNSCSAGFSNI
jgi:hypothetical protein